MDQHPKRIIVSTINHGASYVFDIGQQVAFSTSKNPGTVVGRAEYIDSAPSYYVRFIDGHGDQKKEWFSESDIAPAD